VARRLDHAGVGLLVLHRHQAVAGRVATPFVPFTGRTRASDCTTAGADGLVDLTLQFETQALVAALGRVVDGQVLVLHLTGNLRPEFGGWSRTVRLAIRA
jgi:hypothetical protein